MIKTCIHTVILNEPDEYLRPWLDHHCKMVDNIFIYEDIGSWSHKHLTDQYDNVTLMSVFDIYDEEWQKRKLITNREKGGINQRFYLMDGILKIQALNEYDFCFAIDIDEFITLQPPYESISDVLSGFLDRDAVMLQWLNIGCSGRIYKPNYDGKDYRQFYTEEAQQTENDKAKKITTKLAFNLRRITKWNLAGLHCCPGNWVNTNGRKDRKDICYDRMYLTHYLTKSFEEYLWKVYVRGMHCRLIHRGIKDFFQINPDMMDRYDECMRFKEEYFKKNNIILNV